MPSNTNTTNDNISPTHKDMDENHDDNHDDDSGPKVPWTVADLVLDYLAVDDPRLFLTYHVAGVGWQLGTPVGCVLGAGWYGLMQGLATIWRPSSSTRPSSSSSSSLSFLAKTTTSRNLWQSMGTTGLAVGCLGMTAGVLALNHVASKGEQATPLPWNTAGIAQRVDRLQHNFFVRVLDLSAWSGMAVAASLMMVGLASPTKLRLAPGASGVLQGLTLGGSAGSFAALACVNSMKRKQGETRQQQQLQSQQHHDETK